MLRVVTARGCCRRNGSAPLLPAGSGRTRSGHVAVATGDRRRPCVRAARVPVVRSPRKVLEISSLRRRTREKYPAICTRLRKVALGATAVGAKMPARRALRPGLRNGRARFVRLHECRSRSRREDAPARPCPPDRSGSPQACCRGHHVRADLGSPCRSAPADPRRRARVRASAHPATRPAPDADPSPQGHTCAQDPTHASRRPSRRALARSLPKNRRS